MRDGDAVRLRSCPRVGVRDGDGARVRVRDVAIGTRVKVRVRVGVGVGVRIRVRAQARVRVSLGASTQPPRRSTRDASSQRSSIGPWLRGLVTVRVRAIVPWLGLGL